MPHAKSEGGVPATYDLPPPPCVMKGGASLSLQCRRGGDGGVPGTYDLPPAPAYAPAAARWLARHPREGAQCDPERKEEERGTRTDGRRGDVCGGAVVVGVWWWWEWWGW